MQLNPDNIIREASNRASRMMLKLLYSWRSEKKTVRSLIKGYKSINLIWVPIFLTLKNDPLLVCESNEPINYVCVTKAPASW